MNRLQRRVRTPRARQLAYAAIALIAALLNYSCENRYTVVQAGYNVHPGKRTQSHRKGNDAAFLAETFNNVLLEAQLAELAVRRARSPQVKEFAITVLTDHSIAMDELHDIASRINVSLPRELSVQQRKHFTRIAKKNGLIFDRAFCEFIYLNNTSSLEKFEIIAQEANNENLRDWAWGKLSILKRHVTMAHNVESGSNDSGEVGAIIE